MRAAREVSATRRPGRADRLDPGRGDRRVARTARHRDWEHEVEGFLRDKSVNDAPGPLWLRRLAWELHRFPELHRRLGKVEPPASVRSVREVHIHALREGLPWEKATFAIHFAALKQFLRWGRNPLAGSRRVWRLPSGAPVHRRWLTRGQLERLYRSARGSERLLVALEGLNGLRRIEVLRLRSKDVRLAQGTIAVLGKGRYGGKWRTIPMHPEVRRLIQRSMRGRRDEDRLFPRSASGADLALARAVDRAGLSAAGIKVSHHDLRRTFGRLAHDAGMDLVQLKNLLGHTSVEMTVHYIGIDADRMRSALTRLSFDPSSGRT
ncbi:MAG TPA: site-specific integrase [Thermoplasmata archaeon]|nr:site-specific integrase [Thermoplasmata archaeon]